MTVKLELSNDDVLFFFKRRIEEMIEDFDEEVLLDEYYDASKSPTKEGCKIYIKRCRNLLKEIDKLLS